ESFPAISIMQERQWARQSSLHLFLTCRQSNVGRYSICTMACCPRGRYCTGAIPRKRWANTELTNEETANRRQREDHFGLQDGDMVEIRIPTSGVQT